MPTYYAPGTRRGNKTWVVRGHIGGEQYEIRPETARNKREAEKAWQDFATDTRRDQRDAIRDRETATFDWACDEYLADRPNLNKQQRGHVNDLRSHFAGWFLRDITPEDIYRAAIVLHPKFKPQSRQTSVVGPAATILHYMARRRMCDHIVIPKLKAVGVYRPVTYPEDLQPLIDGATGELKAVLLTLQMQGWRISETIGIRRDRIDWKKGRILRWVSKSKRWRYALVDKEVLKAWEALPEREDGKLFRYKWGTQIYDAVRRLKKRLGITLEWSPHRSRRGLATALRDMGYSVDDIREVGQWEDSRSVETYIADNPDRGRPALEDLRARIGARNVKLLKRK